MNTPIVISPETALEAARSRAAHQIAASVQHAEAVRRQELAAALARMQQSDPARRLARLLPALEARMPLPRR